MLLNRRREVENENVVCLVFGILICFVGGIYVDGLSWLIIVLKWVIGGIDLVWFWFCNICLKSVKVLLRCVW